MSPDRLFLELSRTFPGPRARVFECFADARMLQLWWGPRGFGVPALDFVPSVGGAYRMQMQPPDGEAFHLVGVFREVDPPSALAFTFEWEPADPDDQPTLAQLSFREIGDGTEVRLRQGAFRTEARRALHDDGWRESFDTLGELLREREA